MAISFGAIGAKNTSGTTTISVDYPASPAAGDIAIAGRVLWDSAATATDETGWTAAADGTGGTGSTADSHTSRARIDYRQLDGSETGSVTFDQGGTISGALGVMLRYTKDSSKLWDVAFGTSSDTTHGVDRGTSPSGTINLQTGDMIIAVVAVDTDAALTITNPIFNTNSGGAVVTGTKTRRTSGVGVTTGNDGNVEVFDALVTSGGPQDCTLSFAMTTATSQCGPVAWIRLREVSITGTGAATAPAATASGEGAVSLTGAGTPTAPAAEAAGTGDVSLTGAGAAVAPADVAAGSGSVSLTGAGAATAPAANAAGAGSVALTGSGAATAPTATAAGTGVVTAPPRDITITGRLLESPHSGSLVATTRSGSVVRTYSGRLLP